jgi:hypothetical protein
VLAAVSRAISSSLRQDLPAAIPGVLTITTSVRAPTAKRTSGVATSPQPPPAVECHPYDSQSACSTLSPDRLIPDLLRGCGLQPARQHVPVVHSRLALPRCNRSLRFATRLASFRPLSSARTNGAIRTTAFAFQE